MKQSLKQVLTTTTIAALTLGMASCASTPANTSATAQELSPMEKVPLTATNNMIKVNNLINKMDEKYGTKNVLVIFDIDNTLLTTRYDLGGDIWYQWQTGKLKYKPAKRDKVKCLYSDTIGMLYELAPMRLMEKNIPSMISDLQAKGQTIVGLSSRGPTTRASTERELYRNGIDFRKSAVKKSYTDTPLFFIEKPKRELSYMNGVMLTSGQDKGAMIDLLMKKASADYKAIVFVDDGLHNVMAVQKEWAKPIHNNVETHVVYYSKFITDRIKKHGAILTRAQANKMARQYRALNRTIEAIYPARKKMCLGK